MFSQAEQVRNESNNKQVTVEQSLMALNYRILSTGQNYCVGQFVSGSNLDLKKHGSKYIALQEQQNMSMAVLQLRAFVPKPGFELLFMCYERSEDPFNDEICGRQVNAIFQRNPIYKFLSDIGVKFIILSPVRDQVTGMVPVLAIIDDKQLVANYGNIKEIRHLVPAPMVTPAAAASQISETELQNATTALNYTLLREKANCKGVWKLGNRFLHGGEVEKAAALAHVVRILPMALLKLRYAPDDHIKKDIRTICAALKSVKAPEINDDAKEYAAYQARYLDPLFINNTYYRYLKAAGIRFIVDVEMLGALADKSELFIPIKVIVTNKDFIRQLSSECNVLLSGSQSKSVLLNKRSFLVYLSLLLSDDKWDKLGQKATISGLAKSAPDHIVTMREYLTKFSLDTDDNVDAVFNLIKTVVLSIELEQTKSGSQTRSLSNLLSYSLLSSSVAGAVGIGRHPEVTKLYADLREAVVAISGAVAAVVPEKNRAANSI